MQGSCCEASAAQSDAFPIFERSAVLDGTIQVNIPLDVNPQPPTTLCRYVGAVGLFIATLLRLLSPEVFVCLCSRFVVLVETSTNGSIESS